MVSAKVKRIAFRPRMLFLNHCEDVVVAGIQVQNSPSWNIHPYFSDNLRFIDLKVLNPKVSPNTDGLDPESCKNVEIVGVYFLWEMTVLLLKPEKFIWVQSINVHVKTL